MRVERRSKLGEGDRTQGGWALSVEWSGMKLGLRRRKERARSLVRRSEKGGEGEKIGIATVIGRE